jgi:hypothetical protein
MVARYAEQLAAQHDEQRESGGGLMAHALGGAARGVMRRQRRIEGGRAKIDEGVGSLWMVLGCTAGEGKLLGCRLVSLVSFHHSYDPLDRA